MDRLRQRGEDAERALASLEELSGIVAPTKVERDAAIQQFEYTLKRAGRRRNATCSWWKESTPALPRKSFAKAAPSACCLMSRR